MNILIAFAAGVVLDELYMRGLLGKVIAWVKSFKKVTPVNPTPAPTTSPVVETVEEPSIPTIDPVAGSDKPANG